MTGRTKALLSAAAVLSLAGAIGAGTPTASNPACAAGATVSFAEDILPIFRGRCVGCHQPGAVGYEKSALDLCGLNEPAARE